AVFKGSRPVGPARVAVPDSTGDTAGSVDVLPSRESFLGRAATSPVRRPPEAVIERTVAKRHEIPAVAVDAPAAVVERRQPVIVETPAAPSAENRGMRDQEAEQRRAEAQRQDDRRQADERRRSEERQQQEA